jgi:hypothetical protein
MDDDLGFMQVFGRRIDSEQTTVLKKVLDPQQDVSELRGLYRGLELAKQAVGSIVDELQRKEEERNR